MPTNFELKRLKPKLDIAKKPENRVHELTDSNANVSRKLLKTTFIKFNKNYTNYV